MQSCSLWSVFFHGTYFQGSSVFDHKSINCSFLLLNKFAQFWPWLFTHGSAGQHSHYFQFLFTMVDKHLPTGLNVNICCNSSKIPRNELSVVLNLCWTFYESAKLFQSDFTVYIPCNNVWEFQFLYVLSDRGSKLPFPGSHPECSQWPALGQG